ncbi:MAG: Fe-S-oxidoreductase [Dehalococcoidia bacterium]|jgi:23S rRNA (adenine2503-C2)-methyltransferase
METIRRITVPTGDILIVKGFKGNLELLSIGDYGKDVNLSHRPVVHTDLLPLTDKWVITISTQYGCSMNCTFCDVPKVGPGVNATFHDLTGQILTGLKLHPEITTTKRLNIHFARMGEPSWNPNVLECGKWIKEHLSDSFRCHPVVSTMMPRSNQWLKVFIHNWMRIKNRIFDGEAGLQLSINSTDESERRAMFHGNTCTLSEIKEIMTGIIPVGRKITLNFAIAGYIIDPDILLQWFSPELYTCKLTPMHKTNTATMLGIKTDGDYTTPEPYEIIADKLMRAGYETLVFIASKEEDESRITCGNAILSGGELPCGK